MGLFDHFPYTNVHELNLNWILSIMKVLEAEWEAFSAGNSLTFADPMLHDVTKTYAKNTIVLDSNGNAYVSLQAVPVGVGLQNGDYWLMVFDYEAFIEKVNKNFTARYYRGSYRATAAMAVGDWLTVDDVLCKATAAIAVDDVLEVGVNIEHFTLEDFIKAFMQSANQLIQQYKNDIDASEIAYRQQLAQDIATTTQSLQAQLDQAISGATSDSEVINARIGIDDIAYATLGEAIRTQVNGLTDSLGARTINLLSFMTSGATVHNVSVNYSNGVLTVSGTANDYGGRTTKITRFYLDAGTYTVKEDVRVIDWFIQSAADDSIICAMNTFDHVKTFTLVARTELYIGVNTVNATTYTGSANIIVYSGTGDSDFVKPLIVSDPRLELLITEVTNTVNNRAVLKHTVNNGIADADDADLNRIYLILDATIANLPIAIPGTLITMGRGLDAILQLYIPNNTTFYYRVKWGATWYSWTRILQTGADDVKKLPFNILPAFSNITCCGDSLTQSQVYTSFSDSRPARESYPTVLHRLVGVPVTTLAIGGFTTIDWWNYYENSIVSKSNQLAIIFLGTNGGYTETLDEDAPENDDPSTWVNTNTGCLAKIINKFQSVGAKVCLVKCFVTSGYGTSNLAHTNATIEAAATRFHTGLANNQQLIAAAYHYYPDLSGSNNVHYNDLGYAAFANHLINNIANMDPYYLKYMNPN